MGVFDVFTSDNADEARDKQITGINRGYGRAVEALGQGRDALTSNYTAGLAPFLQNYALSSGQAQQGTTALGNALGLNGADGNAAARSAFQNSPGYTAAVEAATENSLRNRARTGDLRSGATNIDLQNVAQNAQNQQWGNYIQNLIPFMSSGQQGSQAAASGIGSLYSGLGNQLASNFGSLAQLGWQKETGIGNADANAALAGNNASANFVGGLMNLAGLGSNTVGGSALSSMASMIFSDADVKEDIEPVGELYDGQPIYRYTYSGAPERTHIGLIAQNVERVRPDAVRKFGGVRAVDYRKATDFAAGLSDMMEAA